MIQHMGPRLYTNLESRMLSLMDLPTLDLGHWPHFSAINVPGMAHVVPSLIMRWKLLLPLPLTEEPHAWHQLKRSNISILILIRPVLQRLPTGARKHDPEDKGIKALWHAL